MDDILDICAESDEELNPTEQTRVVVVDKSDMEKPSDCRRLFLKAKRKRDQMGSGEA